MEEANRAGAAHERLALYSRVLLPAILLLAFLLQGFWGLKLQTPTIDEFRHVPTGVYYWRTHDFGFDPKTPPFWKMATALPPHLAGAAVNLDPKWRLPRSGWGPWVFGTRFMLDNKGRYDRFFFWSHAVNLVAALLLMLLVYAWARKRYGPAPALVALALAGFSPTLVANARLATPDVAVAMFMACTIFLLARYARTRSWKTLAALSVCFALALLTKFTAVLLAPVVLLAVWVRPPVAARQDRPDPQGPKPQKFRRAGASMLATLLVGAIVLLSVNVLYGFQGFGSRLKNLPCESRSFQRLQGSAVGSCPMPLPAPFLAGFDAQRADSEGGEFPSFLNGEWSSSGWKYYYLAAFGMKETLPFLVLLLIGAVLAVGDRMKRPRISFEDLVFWWVPIALIVVLSFFNRLDVGIRYLLPAYPFLWVFCGGVAASLLKKNWGRVCLGILLAWAIAEPFRAAPHYMAYFNETAGGPRNGYLHLIDSNLDHGQDLRALKNYLDENGIKKIQLAYFGHVWPQLYGIDFEPLGETPKPGVVAISASFLEGQPYLLTYTAQPMVVPLNYYQAMRRYRPVAQIGYSIFVYKIPA